MKKYLFYIILPIVILFSNLIKLDAIINYDYDITYNYNSLYVIGNHNETFFDNTSDREGLLTDLTRSLVSQNWSRSWLIGFSKNDIYYFSTTAGEQFSFNIATYSNNQAVQITPTSSGTYYYYKLSDFSSYTSFKEAIINSYTAKRIQYSLNSPFRIWSVFTQDLRLTDYSYFSNAINDYFIPFYTNSSITNQCYASICSNNDIIFQKPVINSINSYVPFYFELFGFNEPSKSLKITYDWLYSFDILVDTTYIDTIPFIYTFTIPNIGVQNLTYELYVATGSDNLYHYEKLINQIELQNAPNSLLCSGSNCIYTISSSNLVFNTLPKGTRLYIKAKLNTPVLVRSNSLNFTYNQWLPEVYWFNNLSADLLSLTLESIGTNTYMFSNSDSSQNTLFYYSRIPNNDVFYQQPNFINIIDRSIINTNIRSYLFKTLYNDKTITFYQLSSQYKIGNGVALDMSINSNDYQSQVPGASGSFQITFLITPNIYWSNSIISDDRNSVSGCVIDNNTNQCIVVEGDFHNQLSEYTSVENDFKMLNIFDNDMYGLSGVLYRPLDFIKSFNTSTCNSLVLSGSFGDILFPCLSIYYDRYSTFLDIIHILISGFIAYCLCVDMFKTIKKALSPTDDSIEVIDL